MNQRPLMMLTDAKMDRLKAFEKKGLKFSNNYWIPPDKSKKKKKKKVYILLLF